MMQNILWIEFAGRKSTDIQNLVITSISPPTKPTQRNTTTTIPGRSGVLNTPDNSDEPATITVSLFAYNRVAAEKVVEWLQGAGELITSIHPDRIYSATIYSGYAWTEDNDLSDMFTVTISISVHPHPRCDINAELTVLDGQTCIVNNTHNADAYPMISVVRTNEDIPIILRFGSTEILNVTNGSISSVTIDCDIMECFDENQSQINEYCREFPMLQAGKEYAVTVTGGNAYILPRWRCRL